MRIAILVVVLSVTVAAADKPAVAARKLLQSQLDAITKGDDNVFKATLAKQAIILGLDRDDTGDEQTTYEVERIFVGGSPHSSIEKLKIKSLAAGADDKIMWLTSELDITYRSHEPESGGPTRGNKILVRFTELAVKDGDAWKVVTGVIDHPSPVTGSSRDGHIEMVAPTRAGTLAPLLANPAGLSKKLAPDAFVLGTDKSHRGIGKAAAAKLLAKWTKLGLEVGPSVREISGPGYSYAHASVVFRKPDKNGVKETYKMTALVAADGAGSIVAVHFSD